jgi:hypothetical protein
VHVRADEIVLALRRAIRDGRGPPEPAPREVVARLSTSGGRHWGINVGRYNTRTQAERHAGLQTALMELGTLDSALRRKVVQTPRGFEANFVGMSEEEAALAPCRRALAERLAQPLRVSPETLGPRLRRTSQAASPSALRSKAAARSSRV